jgi:hypothetical protein
MAANYVVPGLKWLPSADSLSIEDGKARLLPNPFENHADPFLPVDANRWSGEQETTSTFRESPPGFKTNTFMADPGMRYVRRRFGLRGTL